MGDGCLYFDDVRAANRSKLLVTNYAYWMTKQGQVDKDGMRGLGRFEMLVLDEAHNSVDELCAHLSVELARADVESILAREFPSFETMEEWKEWAAPLAISTADGVGDLRMDMRDGLVPWREGIYRLRALERLARNLYQIANAQGEWVVEIGRMGTFKKLTAKFDPVWPGPYAEGHLFFGIPRVILTSATIRPKTLELLGISAKDIDFVEFPSVFPVSRRPVIGVRNIRVDSRTGSGAMRMWVAKIDDLIRDRLDRKGIIHTVSYDRAKYLVRYSEFSDLMLLHETRTVRDVVELFKCGPPPLVLVSPSMATGFDFPDAEARYQIIAKIPFPDARNKIMAARAATDKTYASYVTMQQLVQACGRGNRSAEDWCENLVVDDHFSWFAPKNRKFAPHWFMDAIRWTDLPPRPLEF